MTGGRFPSRNVTFERRGPPSHQSPAPPAPHQTLAEAARLLLLERARGERERGFQLDDRTFVMDSAQEAWNAVCQGVDHLKTCKGRTPAVGRDAHSKRRELVDLPGEHDLAESSSSFADTLHGSSFDEGRVPWTRTERERRLAQGERSRARLRELE